MFKAIKRFIFGDDAVPVEDDYFNIMQSDFTDNRFLATPQPTVEFEEVVDKPVSPPVHRSHTLTFNERELLANRKRR